MNVVLMGETPVNCYSDDTTLIVENKKDPQALVIKVNDEGEKMD